MTKRDIEISVKPQTNYSVIVLQDEFSHLVQQWNIQRSQALERALTKILYPQLEKELRLKLVQEAKEGILKVIISAK